MAFQLQRKWKVIHFPSTPSHQLVSRGYNSDVGDERRPRPLWLRFLLIFVLPLAIFLVATCVIYPRWHEDVMTSNERSAEFSLRTLSTAEADYRANDRDGNGINDFWTADVSEFSRLGILPKYVGLADASPHTPLVPKPIPHNGYYFAALEMDDSERPPESYRQDTDRKSGKVHHLQKFGFVAYPATPGFTGRWVFIVNENNSMWYSRDATRMPQAWPSDDELRTQWCRVCGG